MLGLAALAALLAMAFVGASSAMAGNTQLCSSEACGTAVTHVHETTLSGAKATLLSSVINVTCDVLFLGDTLGEGAPLVIHGNFTYTNCNSGNCTVAEESADSLIEVLRTGHETSSVTGEGEVNVHCGFFINCTYNGEGLESTGKGPLLSSETNGEVSLSGQETSRVSGFCPESAFLDIRTTPLSATYIGTGGGGGEEGEKMVCLDVGANNGLFLGGGNGTECGGSAHSTRVGKYELGWVISSIGRNEMACAWLGANNGYWLKRALFFGSKECSTSDNPSRVGEYELGVTT